MKASSERPTLANATRAVNPVITPARWSRRTRSAAPCGDKPTALPRSANDALPFRTSVLTIWKSIASSPVVSTGELYRGGRSGHDRREIPHPGERPMRIGVPTEIKTDEYRVALTPAGVRELVDSGHEVLVQAGAGKGSAI